MEFKNYDRVIIKDTGERGYIDTVLENRCLVRLSDGYNWVYDWEIEHEDNHQDNQKNKSLRSDAVRRLLGDI